MSDKEIAQPELQTDEPKAKLLREMESYISGPGVDFEAGFEVLFSYLQDEDPDIRAQASTVLGYHRKAIEKLRVFPT